MQANIEYTFTTEMWKDSPAGWVFVSLPKDISTEIRENLQWQEEGWGRMKTRAKINTQQWDTAIWFDTKAKTYLLPIKSAIRKKGGLQVGQTVTVSIVI